MVCEKCEQKLGKLCTNAPSSSGSASSRPEERKANSNMMLKARSKHRLNPVDLHCRICERSTQHGMNYCQRCAYSRGICSMCGKKILDTTFYKMSTT